MLKVRTTLLHVRPTGNRTYEMRLACGHETRRTVRKRPDGAGLKDPPAALPCRACRVRRRGFR